MKLCLLFFVYLFIVTFVVVFNCRSLRTNIAKLRLPF